MRTFAILAATLALASCGGGGGGGSDTPSTDDDPTVWHFRGINAINDAPVVQFYVDDTAVATADYGAATDYKAAHTGERPLKVAVKRPSDLSGDDPGYADIGADKSYQFDGPTNYTLVAAGTVADPRQYVITDTSRATVDDNDVEIQAINAAVGYAKTVGVYITAAGAGFDSPHLIDTLALGKYSERSNITLNAASGADDAATRSTNVSFEVRVGSTVILQSGTISVAEQGRLLAVVTDNDGPTGSSPVKVLLFGGVAAGSSALFNNITDPGELRFANTSPDAGPLDLIVGTSATDTLATAIDYGMASSYMTLPPTLYNTVGTPTGNPGVFLFVNPVTVTAGHSYTLYAQGPLVNMRGLFVADNRRSVATEAHFRFAYTAATPGGDPIAVYLVPRGTSVNLKADTPPSPQVTSLSYRTVSSQLTLAGGHYDAYFALVGSQDVLLGPARINLIRGSTQTYVLTDSPSGELELLAFNDARE